MIHDIIKIKYCREGFLPNYPPHLISDMEMFDAFILQPDRENGTYFEYMYPNRFPSLDPQYQALYSCIKNAVQAHLSNSCAIPNWIYSYMLGAVITFDSPVLDRHDLFVMLGCDNIDDEFTIEAASACYQISWDTIIKHQYQTDFRGQNELNRVPTIFGEPNIIKTLRVKNAGINAVR